MYHARMANAAIQASLTYYREWERPPLAAFHMRYRGFAATAHHHDVGQLLVPLGGRMHLVTGGRSHVLAPDAAAWLPAGVSHSFVHVDGQLDFLAVELDAPAVPAALAGVAGRPIVARSPSVKHLALTIAQELDAPGAGTEAIIPACIELLTIYLERALAPDAAPAEAASSEVGLVIEAVLASYAEELRVPDLAAMVGLSPRQLERRFQEELGRTPKRFIMEVRVGAAEHMLRHTELPIAQIALDVGFQTPSHFAETFKALTGQPPNAVRAAERVEA